ncbi:M48 family metallopeptidase [Dyella koreensis]|uniref:M48 family metallopeptidase n=1 Tax=Dyella koreensis TaxID=311235 RepID=A0ABW8K001_9GAMM
MKQVLAFMLVVVLMLVSIAATAHQVAGAIPVAASNTLPPSVAHFDADVATNAYLAQLSPEAKAKSDAYFEGGYWLMLWDLLWALGVAWLLLGTRLSVRVRDRVERLTRFRWLQTMIYAVPYLVLTTVLTLPLTFYEGYVREHQYGLSNQDVGQWLGDQAKSLMVTLIFGTVLLAMIYAVIRKAGRTWWIWAAGIGVAFVIFSTTIQPVYIDPLFNTYKSLPDTPLKAEILSMARANGIPAANVYEYDASRRSSVVSANVSGLFGTTRINLNDNLINRSTIAQIEGVLGHEMGHYVLNHYYKFILALGVIIVIVFALVNWSLGWMLRSWGARWGIRDAGDVAGMPLLVALLTLFFFISTPARNTVTRTIETEADIFGLNAAREPDGVAQVYVALSKSRKMCPSPAEEFIFFDHPSGWNRIHRAMVWKGEHLGDPDIRAQDATAPLGAR